MASLSRGRRRFFTAVNLLLSRHTHGQSPLPVLTLFTKRNEPCSLCDQAKEVLQKYETQFVYEEKYIDDPANKEWYVKYHYDIPVLHLNHRFLMKHRVDEEVLRNALDNSPSEHNC